MRMHTGEPYLVFLDTANRALPSWLKERGLRIRGSNLCTEIFLPTSETRTAVCCLSSLNLEYFDDWKDHPDFIADTMEFLDNVLQYFIDHAPKHLEKARHSAERERSVGLGALGFHAYLQKKGIPLESALAKSVNMRIFRHIRDAALAADAKLCEERGPCPDAADAGVARRFSHHTAVAPNASSSLIMGGTSPSIEPYRANIYRQDTISGAYIVKNRFLKAELAKRSLDTDEVWADLIAHDGSIAHREDLPESVRMVFKTAFEIDQRWLVDLAADRQAYIDQARREGRPIIVLAGRPYHMDPEINHGINDLITSFGFVLITEDAVFQHMDKQPRRVLNQWTYHARMYNAARYVCTQPDMAFIQLVSFGCGVDAITTDELRSILEEAGELYTQLKIDDISNLGAVKIRIRSLMAALDARDARNQKGGQ